MVGFVLAGASSNVGKTTIASLLMYAYKQRGYRVQAFKCGPDYLDPTFHEAVTGRPSYNLDVHLMGEKGVIDSFLHYSQDADVVIVEGVMGIYDGADAGLDNGSAAHIARLLGLPLVLVLGAGGVSTTLAAALLGYMHFDARVKISGVILNQLHSERHYEVLKKPIDHYVKTTVYGYVPQVKSVNLKSRHLGLLPANEVDDIDQKLADLYAASSETLDYQAIVAHNSLTKRQPKSARSVKAPYLRLAIAKDEVFYFYYNENLDLLRSQGVELVPFSPLHDRVLPSDISGIYIGGGYPELHLQGLSDNCDMRHSIHAMAERGIPIYAECGGMMYLSKRIVNSEGQAYDMVGVFNANSRMTKRLQHFGYVTVVQQKDTILGPADTQFNGHEFHRSTTDFNDTQTHYRVEKSYGRREQWACGACYKQALGAYCHVHFKQYPQLMTHLIDNMKAWQTWQDQS